MTCTASGALCVIYYCKIVYYLDCALGTGFLTLAAGYTSGITNLAYLNTPVVTVTLNYNL